MKRKIVSILGPDRIGKSTLCETFRSMYGDKNLDVIHLAEPPRDQPDPYTINGDKIQEWVEGGKEFLLFDRNYPCSMVYEELRRGNNGHLHHIIDFELELLGCSETFDVVHVIYHRPWHWTSKHHLRELRELYPDAENWFIRDQYTMRMNEHREYYTRIKDFAENITAFPTIYIEADKHSSASDVEEIMFYLDLERNH